MVNVKKLFPLSGTRDRRPLFGAAMVLGLAVAVVLALPGTAAVVSQNGHAVSRYVLKSPARNATLGAARSTAPRPVYRPPQRYYLALGDSIAYGFQPDKANAAPPSAFDNGYVDLFAARLRKLSPKIQVVNYGCPGESTVTFIRGHEDESKVLAWERRSVIARDRDEAFGLSRRDWIKAPGVRESERPPARAVGPGVVVA